MSHKFLIFKLLLLLLIPVDGFASGVWRSLGYFSLTDEPFPDRCEHFLSFSEPGQMVWLEIQEMIHMETGEIKIFLDRDTVNLEPNSPGDGLTFLLDSNRYQLKRDHQHLWLILSKYKIKFEEITEIPAAGLSKDSFLDAIMGKPLVYKEIEENRLHGVKFVTDTTWMIQHNGDPFDGVWEFIEFNGLFIINGQVSAPFLVTELQGDTVMGVELDYRYPPKKALLRPTEAYFREEE